ncbi:hypothetical protein C2845_PMPSC004493 [Panicum miliaceum]|uniref:Glycosyltransferase n=1 Tax=Panicum miliaceum TaxID=4540 RepID=A0A3L6P9D4_PANMI|nr:hypothetical protein C2845_PMPSC004493 [Panicum miliaceum]
MSPPRSHFLVLTYPLQGHIAPALRLARRLLAVAPDVLVTFSTTEAAHQRLFPAKQEEEGLNGRGDGDGGRLEFIPFSDGTEGGYGGGSDVGAFNAYMASFHAAGPRSVGALVDALAARGRPVSRVVYTLMLPWAADVPRGRGVPSALYWIQPVAVFAVYHHYFHGYAGAVAEHYRRGDPVVRRGAPGPGASGGRGPADVPHRVHRPRKLLPRRLPHVPRPVRHPRQGGPRGHRPHQLVPGARGGRSRRCGATRRAPHRSGAPGRRRDQHLQAGRRQVHGVARHQAGELRGVRLLRKPGELLLGLEEGRRPYLLVVRKDNKATLAEAEAEMGERLENGVVVEWCDQVRVLSHAAVGFFVTHCGWNSVAESVPMVGVPKVSEQSMNARLVEREWRTGVSGRVDDGGVLRAEELRRCVEEVMGNGAAAAEVRRRAREWKRVAAEAMGNGGSSYCNLVAFVDGARSSN